MAEQTLTLRGRQVEILDPSEPLKIGDRIFIRFDWLGSSTYSKAAQWAIIEKALEDRPDFRILSYVNENTYLEVYLEILQEFVPSPEENKDVFNPDDWSNAGVFSQSLTPAVAAKLIEVTGKLIAVAFVGACGYLVIRSFYREVKQGFKEVISSPEGKAALWLLGVLAGYLILKWLIGE